MTNTTIPSGSRSELRELVRNQLQLLLEQKNYQGAKVLLLPVPSVDIAEAIEGLPETLQIIAFRLLKKSQAIEVYEYLEPTVQQYLIEKFNDQEALAIVNEMSPDERVKLFDELPAKVVRRLVSQLSPEERQATSLLLGYQANTAGRIMTPEYIAIKQHLTATQAQEKIRSLAEKSEVKYYLYVTDEAKKLKGIVSLQDLIIAEPEQKIEELMNRDIIYAYTDTDQEEVARLIKRYDLLALPIVDREENLVGVVTVDDVIDIFQEEETEDIYKMAALPSEVDNYFELGLFKVTKRRMPWLLLLLVTNSLTITILSRYELLLEQVVALAFFTPLLVDAGGNIGGQSSTVVVRGFSTDELRGKTPFWVISREAITGAILGLILGGLVILAIFIFLGLREVSLTVGISLLAISIIAACAGSGLPYIFRFFGWDPALMSAPFITTMVDVVGILIYLNIAKLLLGL